MADSESSTVRCVAVKDGSVKAVVGGAIDPLVRDTPIIWGQLVTYQDAGVVEYQFEFQPL